MKVFALVFLMLLATVTSVAGWSHAPPATQQELSYALATVPATDAEIAINYRTYGNDIGTMLPGDAIAATSLERFELLVIGTMPVVHYDEYAERPESGLERLAHARTHPQRC